MLHPQQEEEGTLMVTGQQLEERAMCSPETRKENFQTATYEKIQLGEDMPEKEKSFFNKDATHELAGIKLHIPTNRKSIHRLQNKIRVDIFCMK
jgi:hypothetical protein